AELRETSELVPAPLVNADASRATASCRSGGQESRATMSEGGSKMSATSFEFLVREWDGEELIIRFDRPSGAWILIAIHSTQAGPAGGGTRMKSYPELAAAID